MEMTFVEQRQADIMKVVKKILISGRAVEP